MVDLAQVPHHASVEGIAQVLCNLTRKNDPQFFRILTTYYLAVMAASMRAKVRTKDRGDIPINNYVIALAQSGFGKGNSTYALENLLMCDFRMAFRDIVMPQRAEVHMTKLASRNAANSGEPEEEELAKLQKQLERCGEYPFVFDGASEPAIKQIRDMLLLADCGSINYQVDEIGSNLEKSGEAMNTYLELYDQGMIKQKLTKNSHENKRAKELEGKTPANALFFGTPVRLLDGGNVEKRFVSLLETGYARRCLFASGDPNSGMDENLSAAEIYNLRIDPSNDTAIDTWRQHFASLADIDKIGWTIDVPDDVGIALQEYQIWCLQRAKDFPEHDEVSKAEMEHRYFKALKVAGAYAFIEESLNMSLDQLYSAIKLVEESGKAFKRIMDRPAPYMKLAKYLADVDTPQTYADLDKLPFFKGSQRDRSDLLTMATAWGYKQHIVIQKSYIDSIELFAGETLEETSLDSVYLSYSDHFAEGYEPVAVSFKDLEELASADGMHWTNHAFLNEHRAEDNVIAGFNLMVLDVDGTAPLSLVHELLEDYTFMTYTTKRHTPSENRFRLVMPISYKLDLDKDDYGLFMQNIVEWLPFKVDEAANQRARKWMSNKNAIVHFNRTEPDEQNLLDILQFVPRTSKNEHFEKEKAELASLDSLERWFAKRFAEGNRNNNMIKYALALVDSGMSYQEVEKRVLNFNKQLSNGLSDNELRSTVLVTVAQRMQNSATP